MPIANNHGLTVLTGADADANADTAANRRLRRPVSRAFGLSNRFNDATSGNFTPDFSSGHEGLDFGCGVGTEVRAMYGGEVVDIHKEYEIANAYSVAYGIKVVIKSILENGAGFQHTYAHLAHPRHLLENPNTPDSDINAQSSPSTFAEVPHGDSTRRLTWAEYQNAKRLLDLVARTVGQSGTMLTKGQVIGVSGATGTDKAHLHVHVKPFNERGRVTTEFAPANAPDRETRKQLYPPLATRISGCMNFACFLPADGTLPAITADGPLLNARDAYARDTSAIPVYREKVGPSQRGTINGAKLGCYAVTGQHPAQGTPTRYQIQFTADEKGWVSRLGTVGVHSNVQWVHVQDNTISLQIIPPEPVLIGRPQDLSFTLSGPTGTRITLRWTTPELPAGTAVTGYRINRYLQDDSEADIDVMGSGTRWTDPTEYPAGTYLIYSVSALVGTDEGRPSVRRSVVSGNQALIRRQWGNVEVPALGRPAPASQVVTENLEVNLWHQVTGWLEDVRAGLEDWVRIQIVRGSDSDARRDTRGARSAAARSSQTEGWVRRSQVTLVGSLANVPRPPFVRVTAPGMVPLRAGPDVAYVNALRQIERAGGWYELIGKNGSWWQVRVDASTVGWLRAQDVETTGAVSEVSFVDESPAPEPAGPGGTLPSGNAVTGDSGHYLNLANSWGGAWAVSKSGTTVTAAFQSTRSPVQWYARQNPQDLLVLPAGFRPTVTQNIRVTGVHRTENGVDYEMAPTATFTLRVSTTGAVRYVNHAELDHVGFLRYAVGTAESGVDVRWQTATAATPHLRPTVGEIRQSGTFLNQSEHRQSRWSLARNGDTVTGSFRTTSSPVEHYANREREAILRVPEAYRPRRDKSITVEDARRVDREGVLTGDTRRVDFDLTVQPNGEMWYDRDSDLNSEGVGHLSYTVDVEWEAEARVQVPTVPRALEVDEVTADEVELDWRSPADDGGDSVDEYRVEIYRRGRWRTEEDDISRTRYTVEDLDSYTTYTFRVLAHNAAGWGPASAEVAATTRREEPGTPRSLAATATHDRVTLTWQAPSGRVTVTGYRVQRRVGSGSYRVVEADTGSAVTYWVDRAVTPTTNYSYRVRALNYGEEGSPSGRETVRTLAAPTIPGMPSALTAQPTADSQMQLSWTAPSDLGGGVSGYRIERSPDVNPRDWTEVVADTGTPALSWGDETLAADTVYHYQVRARNSAGVSEPSAAAQGQTRPQLRLDLPVAYPLRARAEPRATAAVTATFGFFLPERTYDLVGQVPGIEGWWQVLLFGATDPGPFWLPAAAGTSVGTTAALPQPPALPGAFTATLANGQVTLSWSAPPTGAAVTGYRLWRQQDDAEFAQLGADLAATVLTHTDSTVQNDHVYRYWLQGLSDAGPGVPTAREALAVMATPAVPAAVTTVTATATRRTLQLGWAKAPTGGLPTGYRLQWRESGTTDSFQLVEVSGTTHLLADLIPGTPYAIQVTAFNQEGDAPVTTHTATTVQVAPGLPTTLAVEVTGQDATVSWQLPATGGRPDAYHLQAKTQATPDWPATFTTVTGLSHALSGLGYEVPHDLRVRARNTAGESDWVTETFTTAAEPQVPGQPTGVTAGPGAESQMQLSWQAAATGSAATGYRIERSADVEPRVWTEVVADSGTPATTWADAGLAASTVYHYQVTGRNAEGLGVPAEAATGTTRPQAALVDTVSYPLTAHAWPEATAPATHTWAAHDATVVLDLAGQVSGTDGWYRVLRFGESASGPYWLPATAVTVTGSTTAVPAVPGPPADLMAARVTAAGVTLSWSAPPTGGTVTGYRLWRQTDTEGWAVLAAALDATTRMHTDTGLAAATAYQYRVQALAGGGGGVPTTALALTTRAGGPFLNLAQNPGGRWELGRSGTQWAGRIVCDRSPVESYANSSRAALLQLPAAYRPAVDTRLQVTGAVRVHADGSDSSDLRRVAFWLTVQTNGEMWYDRDAALTTEGVGFLRYEVEVTWTGVALRPGQPTGLTAGPSADSQMELAWTAAAGGSAATGYRLERSADVNPRMWVEVVADTGTTDTVWADAGLDARTVYHYQVTGRTAAGLGLPAAEATGTTRPQLTLQASATYPLTAHAWPLATAPVTHTWSAHENTGFDLVGQGAGGGGWYRGLRFGESASGPYWLPATAVTVSGATPALAQAPGVPGDMPPPVATHDRITLSWSAPPTGGAVTGYRLWRQTGEADFLVLGSDLAAEVLTHTDRTVTASTTYQYRLQALSAVGAGVRTPAVSVTTAATPRKPGMPTALSAAPGADSQMQLSWTAPADAGTQPVTGYRIERALAADALSWADAVADTGNTDGTWTDSGLTADSTYHYRVSAINAVATGEPAAAAEAKTRPQLTLLASASYPLTARQWPATPAPVTHTWDTHDAAVRLDLVGQGAGGGGWYRALRFGHSAAGPYWLPANAVTISGTPSALPQVPEVPGDFQTPQLQGQVTLSWSAPATGGAVTGYRLWRQTGEAAWSVLTDTLAATARTYTDSTVTAGTTYQYRLQAQAAAGYGVRTAALPAAVTAPPVAPALPTDIVVTQVAATTAQLFWAPVAGASGYDVEMRQSWYAADHAEARVRLPLTGTVTLRTAADSTVEVTVRRTGTLVELSGLPASYSFWDLYVRATNAGGESAWAETYKSNDATQLDPRQPTGLRGQRSAAGSAALSWDVVPGARDYRVYFDFPADDQGAAGWDWLPYRGVEITVTGATATVSGLPTTPATWGFRVVARSATSAESVRSADISVSTAEVPRVPGLPTALTAAPGADSQLELSWTAPADPGTQPVTGYRVERSADVDPRLWTEVLADSGSTDTTWRDSGLTAATRYHYQVSARNSVGVGQPAGETPGTTRPQVTLRATAPYPLTARQWPAAAAPVSHTWPAHDATLALDLVAQGPGAGWWRVLRFGQSASGPYWLPAAAVTVTGSTTAVPAVPGAPPALTATPEADSQMTLHWTAPAAGNAPTGYRIERSADVDPRLWTEVLADSGTPEATWADSGLAAATVYHYRVAGRNAAGLGLPVVTAGTTRPQLTLRVSASYPVTAHAWPATPAPVSHTWDTHDATVHLDLVAQGAGGGGWYRVLRFGESAGGPYWLPASAVTVSGATPALPQAPGVPGDLPPPTATHAAVTLSWTAPTTGGTVTGYRLWRQTGEADFTVLGSDLAADVLTFTDRPVTASTAYQYRVQALAAAGAGVRTPAVRVTTADPPRKPGPPTALTAAPGADSQMQLRWTAPADAGTQPVTGYRIERALDADSLSWADAVADTGNTDVTWTDSGLTAATRYHYRVSAINAVGTGDPAAAAEAKARPQLALLATATYPLTAHAWPVATAPVTHTWDTHDAAVILDVMAQGAGWYRALRFGASASGPYWLPATAVSVMGATSDLPQAPAAPGDLQTTETQGQVTLSWSAPATGGPVTGYRLWRQTGEAAWSVLTDALAVAALTYTDTTVTTGTTYQYRLQAQAAAGYGVRTAPLTAEVTPPPPPDLTYVGAAQTAATTVVMAWDPVPGATSYDVEIQQSHGTTFVLLPQTGTFALSTGAETTDTVTVTVTRTGTTLQLTGLPASYSRWNLYVRATNAGGSSGWASANVTNRPTQLAPSAPTGLTARRSAAGTAALSWEAVPGASEYRVYFHFPDDDQGGPGWDWLPYRGVTVTVTAATATVSGLPTAAATWGLRVSALNGGIESLTSAAVAVANPGS